MTAFLRPVVLLAAATTLPLSAQVSVVGWPHAMLPPETTQTVDLEFADIDGDGDQDLLVLGVCSQPPICNGFMRLWCYRNDGSGVFRDATATVVPQQPQSVIPIALDVGDFDRIGGPDVLLGLNGRVEILQNSGGVLGLATGLFQSPPSGVFQDVEFCDVNGDGYLDVFLATPPQSQLHLYDATLGRFVDVTASNVPTAFLDVRGVAAADFDGDGDQDLFLAGYNSFDQLYLNDGTGVFVVGGQLPPRGTGGPSRGVAVGDVDNDGDIDVVLAVHGGQNRLLLNNGAASFVVASPGLPAAIDWSMAVRLADVDGDGAMDVAWVNELGQPNGLALNDGSGVFTRVAKFPDVPGNGAAAVPLCDQSWGLASADVDGDGDVDFAIGNHFGQNRLHLNDGSGGFVDPTSPLPADAEPSTAVAAGDLNGDGFVDLVVTSGAGGPFPSYCAFGTRMYLNDGAGGFQRAPLPRVGGIPDFQNFGVAIGDLNQDGRLDIVLAAAKFGPTCGQQAASGVLLNQGNNASGVPVFLTRSIYTGVATSAALADVDGDGDLDIALGERCGPSSALFYNDGTGAFTDVSATHMPQISAATYGIAFGDLDGDGDPDLVLANNGQSSVFENQITQNGRFVDATATYLSPDIQSSYAVAIGDLDNVGRLDVVLGNWGSSTVYLNTGTQPRLVRGSVQPPAWPTLTRAVALADVDEDGDLDVVLGSTPLGSGALDDSGVQYWINDGSAHFGQAIAGYPIDGIPTRGLVVVDIDGDGDLDVVSAHNADGLSTGGVNGLGTQDRIAVGLARQLGWKGLPRLGKPLEFEVFGPPLGTFHLFVSGAPWNPGGGLLGWGVVRVLPPLVYVGPGPIDGTGRGSLRFPVPTNTTFLGVSFYWQALVVGATIKLTNMEVTKLLGQ